MKKSFILMLLLLPVYNFGCKQNTISPLPSASSMISSTVSPSTSPTANFIDTGLYDDGLNSSRSCKDIDEANLKVKLDQPINLVVSKDGKKVYVLNRRKDLLGEIKDYDSPYVEPTTRPAILPDIDRQFIYEIKDDKSISIVKTGGQYPFSCQMSQEIAIDSKDNLYITKPVIENGLDFSNKSTTIVSSQKIYKISSEKSISEFKDIKINLPNPLPTPPIMQPSTLVNLYMSNDDQLYFQLVSGSESNDAIKKIDKDGNLVDLASRTRYGSDPGNYAYDGDYLYSGVWRNLISNGVVNREELISKSDDINQIKSVQDTIVDKNGNVYISDAKAHTIWKIVPNKEFIRLAGNGQSGYKDGKGTESQFHYPSAMSLDNQGNLFVADTLNNAIRKITPDGTVSTFYKEQN